jgi:hypothetical protein
MLAQLAEPEIDIGRPWYGYCSIQKYRNPDNRDPVYRVYMIWSLTSNQSTRETEGIKANYQLSLRNSRGCAVSNDHLPHKDGLWAIHCLGLPVSYRSSSYKINSRELEIVVSSMFSCRYRSAINQSISLPGRWSG